MKKLFVATMMLVSGMAFGQQEQTTKPEEIQPATTKTDVSSGEIKTVKDLKSLEGKSFKIKLTARAASEKKTASSTHATSGINSAKEGENNLQKSTGNLQNTAAAPAERQAANSTQQVNTTGSTGKETEVKVGDLNPENSSATTPVPVAIQPEEQQSNTAATTEKQKTDDPSVNKDPSLQPAGIAQPGLNQNQNPGAVTANPSSPGIVGETNKVNDEQTAVVAPVIEKSFENKTVIITLKDGTVNISADDMQFESCPYQVTSGSGSLITFTASCKGVDPADQIWWSGLVDGTTIRGSLLTKAPVGGESTDYTFKGTKTNAPQKRADQKETSLR
jgi:hypothetical protein